MNDKKHVVFVIVYFTCPS